MGCNECQKDIDKSKAIWCPTCGSVFCSDECRWAHAARMQRERDLIVQEEKLNKQ